MDGERTTDEGAASMVACKHFDGLTVMQWRRYHGMYMRDPEDEIFYPKKGDRRFNWNGPAICSL